MPYFATVCSSTAAAIHLPWKARSHGGVRQGIPPSVRPTRTNLDYDRSNITYQMFFSAAAGVMNIVSVFRWLSGTGEKKIRWTLCSPFWKLLTRDVTSYWQGDCTTDFLGDTSPTPLAKGYHFMHTYLSKCLNEEVFEGYTFNGLKFRPNLFEFLLFNWKSIFVY